MDADNVEQLLHIIDLLDRFNARVASLSERSVLLTSRSARRLSLYRKAGSTSEESFKAAQPDGSNEDLIAFGSNECERLPTARTMSRLTTLATMLSRRQTVLPFTHPDASEPILPRRKSVGKPTRSDAGALTPVLDAL